MKTMDKGEELTIDSLMVSLEAAESRAAKAEAAVDKRDAAIAEMRSYVEMALGNLSDAANAKQYDPSWIRPQTLSIADIRQRCVNAYHQMNKALSTDCGRGWLSPPLAKEASELIRLMGTTDCACDRVATATRAERWLKEAAAILKTEGGPSQTA